MDTLSGDDDVEFDSKPMEKDKKEKNPLKFLQPMAISCLCSNSL